MKHFSSSFATALGWPLSPYFWSFPFSYNCWRNVSKWSSRNVPKTGAGSQKSNNALWPQSSLDRHSVQQDRSLQRMNMNMTSLEDGPSGGTCVFTHLINPYISVDLPIVLWKSLFTVEKSPYFKLSSPLVMAFILTGFPYNLCALPVTSNIVDCFLKHNIFFFYDLVCRKVSLIRRWFIIIIIIIIIIHYLLLLFIITTLFKVGVQT